MQDWLDTWGLPPTGTADPMTWMAGKPGAMGGMGEDVSKGEDGLMPGMASPEELAKLRSAAGRDKDILFCQLMIRHHQGGILMAQGLLDRSGDAQVRRLAGSINAGQRSEIKALTGKLSELQKAR